LKINQETYRNIKIIKLEGKLDVHSAPQVSELLEGLIASGATSIVIDMLGMKFISSYGLGLLLTVNKSMKERGGTLRLANLQPEVKVPFEITGLLPQFEIFDSVENALGNLNHQ
jgi:anti-sigma B factor antagonist